MTHLDRRPRSAPETAACATAFVAALLMLGGGAPAAAEGDPLRPLTRSLAPEPDTSPRPPAWMGENVEFRKGYGFEYRRALRMGETPLDIGVLGPVVRKKKSLGLTVEVRF
jgi:hypothetical protein